MEENQEKKLKTWDDAIKELGEFIKKTKEEESKKSDLEKETLSSKQ